MLTRWRDSLLARGRLLFLRRAADERAAQEFAFHLEMETQRHVDAGLSPVEARRRALLDFGGQERYREELRTGRGGQWLEEFAADVRHGLRSLGKARAYTVAASLTLGLGVGANMAVFGLLNASLLRPLPFEDADELVVLVQTVEEDGVVVRESPWSWREFTALRGGLRSVQTMAAYYPDDVNLVDGARSRRIRAEAVSAEYFRLLRLSPVRGRFFSATQDSAAEESGVAVVSEQLWRTEYGSSGSLVGARIVLNGESVEVIGIAPGEFAGLTGNVDVWIPQQLAPRVMYSQHLTTGQHFLSVIARLRPESDLAQVRAELAAAGVRAVAEVHEVDGATTWSAAALELADVTRDPAAIRAQLVLAAAVFVVLLIAVVNLAALMLARSAARSRDSALRAALGAGRLRIVRPVLVESMLIGVLGSLLACILAFWLVRFLGNLPAVSGAPPFRGAGVGTFAVPVIDWRVLGYGFAVALLASTAAAWIPAFRLTRHVPGMFLRSGGRGASVQAGTLRRPTILSSMIMAQVGCAFALLLSAATLLRAYDELRRNDGGVVADGVLTFRISPPETRYSGATASALLEQILARVQALPGVGFATVSRCTPFMGDCSSTFLYMPERPETRIDPPLVGRHYVGPDHFETLGIPLLRGRTLDESDRAGRPLVAVISERAARTLWPDEDPIGRRVWFGSGGPFASEETLTEIVGVVGDVHYGPRRVSEAVDFYTSYLQFTFAETLLLLRASVPSAALVPELRRAVASVDPALPIHDVRELSERAAGSMAAERYGTVLIGWFAAVGLLLAVVGTYGTMAYSVARRRREMGIRLALGAAPRSVAMLILRQGLSLGGAGAAIGAPVALLFAGALASVVPSAGRIGVPVIIGVSFVLGTALLAACALPALAAGRVDPNRTLSQD